MLGASPPVKHSSGEHDEALHEVLVLGMPIAVITEHGLLERVAAGLDAGYGGWIVTANLDVVMHFAHDATAREAYQAADIRIADGMPLVWASRLTREPLPERVTGATLASSLVELAARKGVPVMFLGGAAGTAEAAAERCLKNYPNLKLRADSSLAFAHPPEPEQIDRAVSATGDAALVLVGLGSPKQELLIREMRARLPHAWFVGVGGTFAFLSGSVPRAPRLLQGAGLEWAHRFAHDPRRLGPRYLRNFGFLVSWAMRQGVTELRRRSGLS